MVLYQLWTEISVKNVKHANLFFGIAINEEGFIKKSDFYQAIAKVSIMS